MADADRARIQITPTRWYQRCAFCAMPSQEHELHCVWSSLMGRAEGANWMANWVAREVEGFSRRYGVRGE